jgi:hypothetical protein
MTPSGTAPNLRNTALAAIVGRGKRIIEALFVDATLLGGLLHEYGRAA